MENHFNLDIKRLPSVHLQGDKLIIFPKPSSHGEEISITNIFKETSDKVVILSSITHNEQKIISERSINAMRLKDIMMDCVQYDGYKEGIFSHPSFQETVKCITSSIIDKIQDEYPNMLILNKNAITSFQNGLGIIYEGEKMIGVIERFTVDTNKKDYDIEFEGVLFNNPHQDLIGVTIKCEYYDLLNDKQITFRATAKPYSTTSFNRFEVESYKEIDRSLPIINSIKEAIKVPYHDSDKQDFINEQAYTEYRDSRLSLLSGVRKKERRQAIVNKFSDMDLF